MCQAVVRRLFNPSESHVRKVAHLLAQALSRGCSLTFRNTCKIAYLPLEVFVSVHCCSRELVYYWCKGASHNTKALAHCTMDLTRFGESPAILMTAKIQVVTLVLDRAKNAVKR